MFSLRNLILLVFYCCHAATASKISSQPSATVSEKLYDVALSNGNASQIPAELVSWYNCAQYGSHGLGPYTLYNDLWNQPLGIGSQCVGIVQSSSYSWFTKWSWEQRSTKPQVMSYANAELAFEKGASIRKYRSMRTRWLASYSGGHMSANVAFDIFIRQPGTGRVMEIMAWMKQYGSASPISRSNNPIAEVQLASGIWALYEGHNEQSRMDVYSFVISTARIGGSVDYDGDLLEFMHHLVHRGIISDLWQIIKIDAGTEATTGRNCLFYTSHYLTLPLVK